MLVLSRKSGQEIVIGDGEITLTLLEVGRNHVRIGIAAPCEFQIVRSELLLPIAGVETDLAAQPHAAAV